DSNQYLSAGRATADDARGSGLRRSGRSDVIRAKLPGPVPALCRLCGQDSAWSEAGRPSGRTADQVRSHHKPYDCKDDLPRNSADAARPRRRGDRIRAALLRLLTAAVGTKQTMPQRESNVRFWGKADMSGTAGACR